MTIPTIFETSDPRGALLGDVLVGFAGVLRRDTRRSEGGREKPFNAARGKGGPCRTSDRRAAASDGVKT